MTELEGNAFEQDREAPTPTGIMNNPMADAKVTENVQFGEHDIAICDDGSTIVNGEHLCYDEVGTDTDLTEE